VTLEGVCFLIGGIGGPLVLIFITFFEMVLTKTKGTEL
jgi:hypothetical protein